jgi:hypothetical protein
MKWLKAAASGAWLILQSLETMVMVRTHMLVALISFVVLSGKFREFIGSSQDSICDA